MALRVTRSSLALSPGLASGCCRGLCSGWTLEARKEESVIRKKKELGPSWNGGLGGDVRLLKNYQGERPPWFQFPVISASLASLLLYFCVFREENDIDESITMNNSLYNEVRGLEKQDLMTSIKYYEQSGMDTTALRKRLNEVLERENPTAATEVTAEVVEEEKDIVARLTRPATSH